MASDAKTRTEKTGVMVAIPPPSSGPIPGGGGRAFTLIELLTVIAIIAILATLLMSALGTAKKASRQARCTSNLHQISVALAMYLDDSQRRPPDLPSLAVSRYLANRDILICPSDPSGQWGNLVNPLSTVNWAGTGAPIGASPPPVRGATDVVHYSYLDPLAWDDTAWDQLAKKGSLAGLVACQLHGLGRPNPAGPSIRDFQGLVLRGLFDGAVVKRQVFWDAQVLPIDSYSAGNQTTPPPTGIAVPTAAPSSATNVTNYPWPLFTD